MRKALSILGVWATMTAVACAQMPPGTPATRPSGLPAGHPDISRMLDAQRAGRMPATNPAGQGGALPPGHPDISKMLSRPSGNAAVGTLVVSARQGTPGAPGPVGDQVIVELHHQATAIEKLTGTLDANGVCRFDKIVLAIPIQPVVTVRHADVNYRAVGPVMQAGQSEASVEVSVFETTEQEPQWQIRMRHLILHNAPEGLHVTEMLAVESLGDRAWVGRKNDDGSRTTLVLPLPPGATGIQFREGFDDCCTKIDNGRLLHTMPLTPGLAQYQIGYTIPARDGRAQITVAAPAAVKHLMIFVPDDGSTVTADGLELVTPAKGNESKSRFYKAVNQTPGQMASMTITGMMAPAADKASPDAPASTSDVVKMVVGAGGILIVLVAVALMFIRAPKNAAKRSEPRA
jgi:hypothetical protein